MQSEDCSLDAAKSGDFAERPDEASFVHMTAAKSGDFAERPNEDSFANVIAAKSGDFAEQNRLRHNASC
jgi:hypothetical protein